MKLYIKQKVFSFRDRFSIKDESGNDALWMLRTPGRLRQFIMGVGPDGSIGFTGYGVEFGHLGVRPAMWVKA